jgi:hypothetical protein
MIASIVYVGLRVGIALTLRKQQVCYLFIIDLKEGYCNSKLSLGIGLHIFKNMIHAPWNHSTLDMDIPISSATSYIVERIPAAEDCMGLSTAGLPISHDDAIKSI